MSLRETNNIFFPLFLFATFLLTQCTVNPAQKPIEQTESHFNTLFSVRIFSPYPDSSQEILEQVWAKLDSLEKITNFYDSHSLLSIINQHLKKSDKVTISNEILYDIIKKSVNLGRAIDFNFHPAVGSLSQIWPFGAVDPVPPNPEKIRKAVHKIKLAHFQLKGNILYLGAKDECLDLSAINKGYAVDYVKNFLKEKGIRNAIIDAGGNLGILWERKDSIVISIRHPESPGAIIGYFLTNQPISIATSGDYMNYFEYQGKKYHHILDPSTGYPSDSANSVTIIAPDATEADGLSTGLFVAGSHYGVQWLKKHEGYEGLFIQSRTRRIIISRPFPYPFTLIDSTYSVFYE